MVSNITSIPSSMNTSANFLNFTTSTDALEEVVELSTDYNGSDVGGWPYFDLLGLEYWVIVVIVVSFGLVGNVLSFFLLSDKQFSCLSYPVYLKALAVSDSLQMIIQSVPETQETFAFSLISNSYDVVCKLWQFARYNTLLISPWLVVGLTLDRYVCVLFPLTRYRFCTKKKALIFCCCLALVSALTMLPILTSVKLVEGYCRGPPAVFFVFIVVRLVLSSTLPCLLILFFNVIIITRIQRSAEFRKIFTSSRSSSTRTHSNEDSSTRPLMLISVFAFVTLLPLSVAECVEVLLQITGMDAKAEILSSKLWPIFHVIYLLNFGMNFYILMASSRNYRKILATKLKCSISRPVSRPNPERNPPIPTVATSSSDVSTLRAENIS
ncbi:succinate receptor 1-like [Gigantopelta aegis]|uniref:succinate receptor 1-like n=1 Tax=Gigantopelta aegis TaxID=1735272 RepID=UPI001B88A6CF|nr:succinate receptor 1-like [Gigantopelta aegis]